MRLPYGQIDSSASISSLESVRTWVMGTFGSCDAQYASCSLIGCYCGVDGELLETQTALVAQAKPIEDEMS
jgi:hypothetical protein